MAALIALAPVIGDILDKFLPDKSQADAAKLEVFKAAQQQQMAEMAATVTMATGQQDINKVEAASSSWWVAGWRPAVGWCCAAGFLWATIGYPIAGWLSAVKGWPLPPQIDTEVLLVTLGGLLGLGSLRTVEKVKGAA